MLQELAIQQNPVACYRLGELYEFSIGCDYNPDEAEKYYSMAKELGYRLAEIRFNVKKSHNIDKSDIDYLCKNKSDQARMLLAHCFYYGIGVERSVEQAMDELETLSESKHPLAYYQSAQIVKEQFGEEQGELLIELLLKSADMGYAQAQVDLMNIYAEGKYVPECPQLCIEFAQKASLQGHPEALFMLAICLIKGYGTKKNKVKAKEFLKMAADRGNSDAIEILKSLS